MEDVSALRAEVEALEVSCPRLELQTQHVHSTLTLRPRCLSQALLSTKKAALHAAAPADAQSSPALVWPFSASCGRATIASVHAAPGQGLSLVRTRLALRVCLSFACARVWMWLERTGGALWRCHIEYVVRISTALTRALSTAQVGTTLRVGGWVKTGRTANKDTFAFLELNDGTTPVNLQVRPSSDGGDNFAHTPQTRLNHVALSVSFCSRCWCPQKCTRSRSSDTLGRACLLKAR
jgi:hypothetical protein